MADFFTIKYVTNGKLTEISVSPFSFSKLTKLLGPDVNIAIEKLYVYNYADNASNDRGYTEDDFIEKTNSLKSFLTFLEALDEYRIYRMSFIDENQMFKVYIDEELVKITFFDDKDYLHKILSLFPLSEIEPYFDAIISNIGLYVCFTDTPNPVFISPAYLDVCEFYAKLH